MNDRYEAQSPGLQSTRDHLLPSLSNGQHVILSEFGHGEMVSLQPEATVHLLTSFYDTGAADDSLFTYQPMDFNVGLMSFPFLAKALVVLVTLVLLLLAVLVWYIMRRMRRS